MLGTKPCARITFSMRAAHDLLYLIRIVRNLWLRINSLHSYFCQNYTLVRTGLIAFLLNRAYRDCKKEWVGLKTEKYINSAYQIGRLPGARKLRRLPAAAGSARNDIYK